MFGKCVILFFCLAVSTAFAQQGKRVNPGKLKFGLAVLFIHTTVKTPEKLLESKTHAADLGYIPSSHLLLVPTFTENWLVAYQLELNK